MDITHKPLETSSLQDHISVLEELVLKGSI